MNLAYQKRLAALAKRDSTNRDRMTIQPGCIYYDITNRPIGSRARRAPDEGLAVTEIESITQWHGCNRIGRALQNSSTRIAFHTDFTREHYHDK